MHYSYLETLALTRFKSVYDLIPRSFAKKIAQLIRAPLDFVNARKYSADTFAEVEVYCMFIGYPRSGHTLMAALLDAHPNIVISNEMDALHYVDRGLNQTQIFSLILNNSQSFAKLGNRWTGYDYLVRGQWQGKFTRLKCIGDKKGGMSARRLRQNPRLLKLLTTTINKEIKLIHIVRNPYDNVATLCLRDQLSLDEAIVQYFTYVDAVIQVRNTLPDSSFLTVRHEAFVNNPRQGLEKLCRFLNQECPLDYLEACSGVVFESTRKSRYKVNWDTHAIRQVEEQISYRNCDFLEAYSFNDET